MINPIRFEREDTCVYCNSKRSIELYDNFNRPMNYTLLLDSLKSSPNKRDEILNKLDNKVLGYMRCNRCKRIYKIHWNKNFPYPLNTDTQVRAFIDINYVNK